MSNITFTNPARQGSVKFYALHEREGEYHKLLLEMMRFLPGSVNSRDPREFFLRAKNSLNELCRLGLFKAYPDKLVVAMAFVIAATTSLKRAYTKQAQLDSAPFWEDWNTLVDALADSLSAELGAEKDAIKHKLFDVARIMKAL